MISRASSMSIIFGAPFFLKPLDVRTGTPLDWVKHARG
jgi:hypothetical protein